MFLCCTANLVTTKVMPQETSKIDSNINLKLKNILNIYFVFWVTYKKGQHVLKIIGGLNGCLCIVKYAIVEVTDKEYRTSYYARTVKMQ